MPQYFARFRYVFYHLAAPPDGAAHNMRVLLVSQSVAAWSASLVDSCHPQLDTRATLWHTKSPAEQIWMRHFAYVVPCLSKTTQKSIDGCVTRRVFYVLTSLPLKSFVPYSDRRFFF
jgi:hypothetical protein